MREPQSAQEPGGPPVDRVIADMRREFHSLLLQRAAILRRIGTIKQIINGLSNIFGDQVVGGGPPEFVDRRSSHRHPGFTDTCRLVLMESKRPLMSQEVYQEIERRNPTLLLRHRDPLASVSTVLNRLSKYGETRVVLNERGRRAWEWTTNGSTPPSDTLRRAAEQ